jgi:hypothetical protein
MRRALLALLPLVTLAACDKPRAWGDVTSIIVAASDELWAEIQDSVYAAVEPRIFTVRNERTFNVTQQDPLRPDWENLQRFAQVLAIGSPGDVWVAEALAGAEGRDAAPSPELLQVEDVWSHGQRVTVLVLPEGGGAADVYPLLQSLHDLLDRQYRAYVEARMFMTGRDTALASALLAEAGFSVLVPDVYESEQRDEVYIFRNDNPDPSELIRQVAVTWQSPLVAEMGQDEVLAWRARVVSENYNHDQIPRLDLAVADTLLLDSRKVFQLQAIWENPADLGWPAAGPFILRTFPCPEQNRLYLLDAWLYAPGKQKYEYMLQLETILDSFRCS